MKILQRPIEFMACAVYGAADRLRQRRASFAIRASVSATVLPSRTGSIATEQPKGRTRRASGLPVAAETAGSGPRFPPRR